MDEKLRRWRADGHHLPPVLKDFHDQKEVFRAVHETVQMDSATPGGAVNSIAGHCYVLDRFLWFMARHGYTLQRSRSKQNFESLETTLKALEQERSAAFAKMLASPTK